MACFGFLNLRILCPNFFFISKGLSLVTSNNFTYAAIQYFTYLKGLSHLVFYCSYQVGIMLRIAIFFMPWRTPLFCLC